jgi:hypothetical protein
MDREAVSSAASFGDLERQQLRQTNARLAQLSPVAQSNYLQQLYVISEYSGQHVSSIDVFHVPEGSNASPSVLGASMRTRPTATAWLHAGKPTVTPHPTIPVHNKANSSVTTLMDHRGDQDARRRSHPHPPVPDALLGTKTAPTARSKRVTKLQKMSIAMPSPSKKARAVRPLKRTNETGEVLEWKPGVTVRPSGKWQSQVYYSGKSRYIGVFETYDQAATAYEVAREHLKGLNQKAAGAEDAANHVNDARRVAHAALGMTYSIA